MREEVRDMLYSKKAPLCSGAFSYKVSAIFQSINNQPINIIALPDFFIIFEMMLTYNTILKELKDVPVERLKDLYDFIHSLNTKTKKSDNTRKKILSFGGSFSDMTSKDYKEFVKETKEARTKLLDRNSY